MIKKCWTKTLFYLTDRKYHGMHIVYKIQFKEMRRREIMNRLLSETNRKFNAAELEVRSA